MKLGEARLELKQLDAAQAALTKAIQMKPDQSMAHYDLALVHEARGDAQSAAAAYEAEIAVSPKLYQPHFNLAKLLAVAVERPRRWRTFAPRWRKTQSSAPATCISPSLSSTPAIWRQQSMPRQLDSG